MLFASIETCPNVSVERETLSLFFKLNKLTFHLFRQQFFNFPQEQVARGGQINMLIGSAQQS